MWQIYTLGFLSAQASIASLAKCKVVHTLKYCSRCRLLPSTPISVIPVTHIYQESASKNRTRKRYRAGYENKLEHVLLGTSNWYQKNFGTTLHTRRASQKPVGLALGFGGRFLVSVSWALWLAVSVNDS